MKRMKLLKNAKNRDTTMSEQMSRSVLSTTVDILNYRPESFWYSGDWVDFIRNAPKSFTDTIVKAQPDELNGGMLDAEIESVYRSMLEVAAGQFTAHCDVITQLVTKLRGEKLRIEDQQKLLEADKADIAARKAALKAMVRPDNEV